MTKKELEDYLWSAANILRGMIDAADFTANFVQTRYKYGKMKKIKEVNEIWQHIR